MFHLVGLLVITGFAVYGAARFIRDHVVTGKESGVSNGFRPEQAE